MKQFQINQQAISQQVLHCTTNRLLIIIVRHISKLLETPLCVSGFIRGLNRFYPTSSSDIDAIRDSHVTVRILRNLCLIYFNL